MLEDIAAIERRRRIAEEILHELKLHLRKLDRLARLHQRAVAQVQHKLAGTDFLAEIVLVAHLLERHAAIDGVHAGDELARAERLRHVIVRAHHQAADLIHFLRAGREQNDADRTALFAQLTAHRQPVELAGHHNVEKGHVDAAVLALVNLEGLLARARLKRVVAGAPQIDDHKFADGLFVLRHQNFFHCFLSSAPPKPAASVIPASEA